MTQQSVAKLRNSFVLIMAGAFFSACAHLGPSSDPSKSGASGNGAGTGASADAAAAPDAAPVANDLSDSGNDLKAVPLAVNRQVLKWIDYFQGQGRPHMERYLSRSTRYMPVMKKILKERGLPEDLIYIALIESGFSGTAHSSASAVGYWQFIRGTGRRYGMKIDTYVDERRDFIRSTQAAADYFKGLYEIFHSWYLAIASYNVGEGRVKKVVEKYRTRDFWQLARENKLPEETSNYVPKFIAARLIAKAPEKYGFTDIDYMPPLDYSDIEFTSSVDIRKLAKEMGLEYDDLRDLNPSYKRGVAFERNGKLTLRVPKGSEEKATAAIKAAVPENKKVYVADEDYGYYRIRRGDTISSIAKKFGTSQRVIRQLNKLSTSSALIAGKKLRVPGETVVGVTRRESAAEEPSNKRAAEPKTAPGTKPTLGLGAAQKYMTANREPQSVRAQASQPTSEKKLARRIHIVRKGDTLIQIAHRYRVSLRELTRRNKISRRAKISIGTRLEIP